MLEVTARSAADILGIQPNSAILFYHKIRQVIDYHLSLEADDIFEGKIELDESYFGGRFETFSELEQLIHEYIHYYNTERIQVKLKGLSPVQYRTQSLN